MLGVRSEPFQYLATELNYYMLMRVWKGEYCIHLNCEITSEAGIEVNRMKSGSQKTICKIVNE